MKGNSFQTFNSFKKYLLWTFFCHCKDWKLKKFELVIIYPVLNHIILVTMVGLTHE
jgi:hypothetical protein